MKVEYDVKIPETANQGGHNRQGESVVNFIKFMHEDRTTMCITFDSTAEALRGRNSINMYVRNHKLADKYLIVKRANSVYVGKKGE